MKAKVEGSKPGKKKLPKVNRGFVEDEAELSDDEIIERVRRGQWSFAARRTPWEGVSSAAKQLIAAREEGQDEKSQATTILAEESTGKRRKKGCC